MPIWIGAEIGMKVGLAVGAASSGVFGINSALNMAINAANSRGQLSAAEIQFDGWVEFGRICSPEYSAETKNIKRYANAQKSIGAYINASENALIDTHNAFFIDGQNISQVLKGGTLIADKAISAVSNGDQSGVVQRAADWFDMSMILGLINSAWKQDDNFIVFVCHDHQAKASRHTD